MVGVDGSVRSRILLAMRLRAPGGARTEDSMYAAFQELGRSELVLYTDSLIARGTVRTRQHRVTDILNLADDPFLILEDVTVDEYGGHGQPLRAAYAQINLDTVLFAVANTPVEPIPDCDAQDAGAGDHRGPAVPGHRHRPPAAHRRQPAGGADRADRTVLPVTDATFWSDHVAGRARPPRAGVNHRRAQILAPHKEVDPWAGCGGTGVPRPRGARRPRARTAPGPGSSAGRR